MCVRFFSFSCRSPSLPLAFFFSKPSHAHTLPPFALSLSLQHSHHRTALPAAGRESSEHSLLHQACFRNIIHKTHACQCACAARIYTQQRGEARTGGGACGARTHHTGPDTQDYNAKKFEDQKLFLKPVEFLPCAD